jgi:hypothetical protein
LWAAEKGEKKKKAKTICENVNNLWEAAPVKAFSRKK